MPKRLHLLVALVSILFATNRASAQTTAPSAPALPPAPRIKLWDTTPGIVPGKDTDTDPTEPTMDIYLPANQPAGPAIIVLPGGGYTHLSTAHEGSEVARMLISHNIAAFVVRYRHAPRYHHPFPMMDAQRALRTVRAKAAEYNIDPNRIGVIGFSAGGHLAATLATQFDAGNADSPDPIERVSSRPDFAILLYPVITFTDEAYVHKGSRDALLGNRRELFAAESPELHVTSQTPPIFLAHASTDRTVPVENSVLFYTACHKNHVPAELHLFELGSHGFGLAPTDRALRIWPELMLNWMAKNKWIAQ